jgi:AcrR family transcriptional regulator
MPKPSRSRLPANERRTLIVGAALAEFAHRGYEAASMGRIATAAGISRTVLYDHFPSKQALFVELVADQHATLLAHLRQTIATDAPMEERLRATVDAFFAFAEEEPLAWRLLFPDNPPLDPGVAADHRRSRLEYNRLLARLLAPDARRAGIDPTSHVGAGIFAIHQAALHGAVAWWNAHPEVDRSQLVEATMAVLWDGLSELERGSSAAIGV